MADNPFDGVDDELRKDAGCTTELDYIEQSSWLLFLKYLDSMENRRKLAAEIQGKSYSYIIDEEYRWETWAAPKKDGKIDYNVAMTGDDLHDFVNRELFPYLGGFSQRATSPDTIEYKIGEIFSELKNRIQSGYNLREVVALIDEHEAMLKRIRKKGKVVALESANKNYETKIFGPDRVKVQGVLVSLYRNF